MDGTGALAVRAIAETVGKGLALLGGGGVLLEGVALSSAKALENNRHPVAKVAKCALAALALLGALAATASLAFTTLWLTGAYTSFFYPPLSLPLGYLAGVLVAAGTLPLHQRAFQWSGLVAQSTPSLPTATSVR